MADLRWVMTEDYSRFETLLRRLAGADVLILFVFHAVVFAVAYASSDILRFEFATPPEQIATFRSSLAAVVGIQLMIGVFFGSIVDNGVMSTWAMSSD